MTSVINNEIVKLEQKPRSFSTENHEEFLWTLYSLTSIYRTRIEVMGHEFFWILYFMINVWNIINCQVSDSLILLFRDISFTVGKIPNLSWREISLEKYPTFFSLITGMKIIDDCMHLVPLYSVFTSIRAYRV